MKRRKAWHQYVPKPDKHNPYCPKEEVPLYRLWKDTEALRAEDAFVYDPHDCRSSSATILRF